MTHTFFPRPLAAHALADTRSRIALLFDLVLNDEETWLKIVSDAGKDRHDAVVIGYMKLRRLTAQRPGLATYAVVSLRSADAPPPAQSVCQQVFGWHCPADYELLIAGKSVLTGWPTRSEDEPQASDGERLRASCSAV